MGKKNRLFISTILERLPHRYPFLFVDRVLTLEEGKKVVGLKNVTVNEPYFQGHFPGFPVMPGVLIVEAVAQLAGILLADVVHDSQKVPLLMRIEKVTFRKPVIPGDQLILHVYLSKLTKDLGHIKGKAYVMDTLVAEGEGIWVIVNKDELVDFIAKNTDSL